MQRFILHLSIPHTLLVGPSSMVSICDKELCPRFLICMVILSHLQQKMALCCRYRISPNKRTGRRGRKWTLALAWFWWTSQCGLTKILNLGGRNMIKTGSVVSQICPVKVKSRGHGYSSRHVYSARYGMSEIFTSYHHCVHHPLRHQTSLISPLRLSSTIVTQYDLQLESLFTSKRHHSLVKSIVG